MNAPIRRLALAVVVLFGLLLLNANRLQVLQADDLRDDPRNSRTLFARYDAERGPILAGDRTLAESVETDDALRFLRQYPEGVPFAHVTGYYSFIYGNSELERQLDGVLSGDAPSLVVRRLSDLLTGRTPVGGTVVSTIVPEAQEAAYQAFDGQRGAAVALDPETGAILALVSSPSYDPAELSSHDPASIRSTWDRLTSADAQPLLNRALASRYPPGSTFKVITAAAALEGDATPSTVVDAPAELDLPQTSATLRNFGGSSCDPNGRQTLLDALRISCNTAFGQLGIDLGAEALRAQAQAFGFGTAPQVPMQAAVSIFPEELNAPQTAQSAIGQFDVQMTPLQGAMMVAGVANGGRVMAPYLVQEVQAPDLTVIDRARPETYSEAISDETAAELTEMMVAVVARGSGRSAQIPGVTVAGKTGTAQQGEGEDPHAWFVGFAPADDPQVAIAVVVEDGGSSGSEATGGSVAAPIFKAAAEAVLEARGVRGGGGGGGDS